MKVGIRVGTRGTTMATQQSLELGTSPTAVKPSTQQLQQLQQGQPQVHLNVGDLKRIELDSYFFGFKFLISGSCKLIQHFSINHPIFMNMSQ